MNIRAAKPPEAGPRKYQRDPLRTTANIARLKRMRDQRLLKKALVHRAVIAEPGAGSTRIAEMVGFDLPRTSTFLCELRREGLVRVERESAGPESGVRAHWFPAGAHP